MTARIIIYYIYIGKGKLYSLSAEGYTPAIWMLDVSGSRYDMGYAYGMLMGNESVWDYDTFAGIHSHSAVRSARGQQNVRLVKHIMNESKHARARRERGKNISQRKRVCGNINEIQAVPPPVGGS